MTVGLLGVWFLAAKSCSEKEPIKAMAQTFALHPCPLHTHRRQHSLAQPSPCLKRAAHGECVERAAMTARQTHLPALASSFHTQVTLHRAAAGDAGALRLSGPAAQQPLLCAPARRTLVVLQRSTFQSVWGLRLRGAQLTPEGHNALRTLGTPLHVMIAGAPAAGKGTQCQRIVEKVLHRRRACQSRWKRHAAMH